jgi:hypothetical protein
MPSDDGVKSKLSLHSQGNTEKLGEKINIFIRRCKNLVILGSNFEVILKNYAIKR